MSLIEEKDVDILLAALEVIADHPAMKGGRCGTIANDALRHWSELHPGDGE